MALTPERYIADSSDPDAKCAGGKTFEECGTAQTLMEVTDNFTTDPNRYTADGKYNILKLPEATLGCVACRHICFIVREISGGKPTLNARIICDPPQ